MARMRISERVGKYRWWILGLGGLPLSVLLVSFVSGCGGHGEAKENKTQEQELSVSTTTPKSQMLRRYILQPGVVASYEETPIYSKIPGYLEKINVDIGDKVKKDQLLAELWVPEVEEEVRVKAARVKQGEADIVQTIEALRAADANIITAEARVEESVASVIRATAFRKRWQDEYARELEYYKGKPGEKGFLNKKTLDEAEHQLNAAKKALEETELSVKSAQAALAESKAKREKAAVDVKVSRAQLAVWKHELEEQEHWFAYAKIKSPFDGIVTQRIVHTGHFVQPANSGTTSKAAEPLFVVMRTDIMRVVVPVPEYDAPLVKDGAKAIIRLQAYPGEAIVDRVERSSWSLDNIDRTLRVEIFLNNDKNKLQPGMYGNISIEADLPNTLCLPAESILTDGNKNYIFLLEDGKARRTVIKTGITNDAMTEVIKKQLPPSRIGGEGEWVKFTGSEQVIISNLKSIQDGQPARAK